MQGKVSIGVVKRGEKLLLVKRSENESSAGKWCFPGGSIEEGETSEEAAIREVVEETGLDVQIIDTGESFVAKGELGKWQIYPFLMSDNGGEVELNHENSEFKWLEKHQMLEYDTLGDMQAVEILGL